jgi:epoxyqueuosine reductase
VEGTLILESETIVARARELGADLVGIVESMPLGKEAENLDLWLNLRYHGTMGWMAQNRDVRKDPGKLLEGCRSIIMIAVNYFSPHLHLAFPNFPRVSRYAWGRDYHTVLRGILKKLATDLDETAREAGKSGAEFKIAVDSAPFRDKVWAQRAGLGWIGRNTNLVTREYGSWVFIGGLLTTLEIEPTSTEPHPDHCGTCSSCIEACPTGALMKPGRIDARVCISYLTIEHEGQIPPQFDDSLSGWVFGCDICQDVCPWNRFAKPTKMPDFEPRPGLLVPDLHLWSQMSPDEYERLTEGTPLRRAGREHLRRNALAVMGLL